jgi:hypothetical protein
MEITMLNEETADTIMPLEIADPDFKGTVFIIPLGAPIPQGIDVSPEMVSGTLLHRLQPLGQDPEGDYAVVALSGGELLDLERAWPAITEAKKVAVLGDIPGATYDILFSQAKRAIGVRTVDWPSVEQQMSEMKTIAQRTKDAEPWTEGIELPDSETPKRKPKGSTLTTEELAQPESYDED